MSTVTYYRAGEMRPLIAISDEGPLTQTLDQVMLGWSVAEVSRPPQEKLDRNAAICIERGESGWTCSGLTYDEPLTFSDPVTTACSLIAALYKAHTLADRERLCLHAAGVRIGRGMVLLTGHYRAGKSVVSTACAAAGMQVFSDDIIPLDLDGRTVSAPGLAIRLRLPLPETLAPETRDFVAEHQIATSKRYAYIRPPADQMARHGETAPIRGVVSLRRTEGAPAELSRLIPGDALSETIRRNFAREVPAGRILDAFDGLLLETPCLGLVYDRAEDAARLLHDAFTGSLPKIATAPPAATPARKRAPATPLAGSARLRRQPGAQSRERDGQAFLTDAEELVIFNLNPTATAIWRVLETPTSFAEIMRLFAAGFPDRDPVELEQDLTRLIRDLAADRLVLIGDTEPAK